MCSNWKIEKFVSGLNATLCHTPVGKSKFLIT